VAAGRLVRAPFGHVRSSIVSGYPATRHGR
jgi:hypothetical protein